MSPARRYPVGAERTDEGCSFRVWAPERQQVRVVIDGEEQAMIKDAEGYFSLTTQATAGTLYGFRLDDLPETLADPASRCQPTGPAGLSMVTDSESFVWQDEDWRGVASHGQILYEMHVGTFTPEGSWRAAAAKLPKLRDLGVTVIEMMPVHEFHGGFGWGYDGVLLFAPTRLYGAPEDLKAFVDAAHGLGMGVILDVVYNHFGPGERMKDFSRFYFTDRYANDWGESINFDGDHSRPTRDFFIANARYWIDEFHFDGLRLDATQALYDDSQLHILAEITEACRQTAEGRMLYIIGENEPQEAKLIRPTSAGGYGLDGVWNDDFHHSAKVALTGRNEAYLHDHQGRPQEFLAAAKFGYLFQGQRYDWQDGGRGTPALDLGPGHFVHFLENHDQIANSAKGLRMTSLASPQRLRAMTALLLLGPQTPMLFQGQEFGATTPFFYFSDQRDPMMMTLVRDGRGDFLNQFASIRDPQTHAQLADPCDPETFERSKLDWDQWDAHDHIRVLHRDLLALRRAERAFDPAATGRRIDGSVLSGGAFFLRFFGEDRHQDRLLLINFGKDLAIRSVPDPLFSAPEGQEWSLIWSSEWDCYGGVGQRPVDVMGRFVLTADSALVLAGRPRTPRPTHDKSSMAAWQDAITA